MKNPSISVIIPVYNAEAYIDECLESIARQTFTDYELILINDGSADGSAEKCRRKAAEDDRIVFIDRKNGGVSSARNAGLNVAHGKWIVFADADDHMPPEALQKLFDAVQTTGSDFVCGNFRRLTGNRSEDIIFPSGTYDSTPGAVRHFALWGQIFSKDIIDRNHLRFDEKLTHSEDALFVVQFSIAAEKITHISDIVYNYRIHASSACNAANAELRLNSHISFAFKLLSLAKDDRTKTQLAGIASAVLRGAIAAYAGNSLNPARLRKGWRLLQNGCPGIAPAFHIYLAVSLKARCRTIKKHIFG